MRLLTGDKRSEDDGDRCRREEIETTIIHTTILHFWLLTVFQHLKSHENRVGNIRKQFIHPLAMVQVIWSF